MITIRGYSGHSNVSSIQLLSNGQPYNLSQVIKVAFQFNTGEVASSELYPQLFDWTSKPTSGVIYLLLGTLTPLNLSWGPHVACLILYDYYSLGENGMVWGNIRIIWGNCMDYEEYETTSPLAIKGETTQLKIKSICCDKK